MKDNLISRSHKVRIIVGIGIMLPIAAMQAFGVYFLGVTFDYLDILMFGIGVGIAVFLDKQVFERRVAHWKLNK